MSIYALLEDVKVDTEGRESNIRQSGNFAPPAKIAVQISVTGTARVQIQVKTVKLAPWADVGPPSDVSGLLYVEPMPFIRAIASGMGQDSSASVWASWGWH